MAKLTLIMFLLIPSTFKLTFAQTNYSANLGGTNSTNYFITVPYETINNLIIIETIIEGDKYRFLFDTGAVTMISNKLYRKLELPVLHKIPIYDYNEIVDTNKVVSLSHIVIGDIVFSDIPAVVNSDDSSIVYNCLEIDGIIGSNLLRNSIVRFSSREQIVYLTDTPERFNLGDVHASELFLSPLQSIPYIWVAIKNNRQNRVQLIFDSGANDFLSLSLRHFDILNKRSSRAPFHILSSSKGSFNMGLHGVPIDVLHHRLISNELVINQSVFTNITYNTSNSNNSSLGVKILTMG
jgi:predicted aspartyl protease